MILHRHHTYADGPGAEHELWHPHYLQAIATTLDRLKARPAKPAACAKRRCYEWKVKNLTLYQPLAPKIISGTRPSKTELAAA